jgi:peptide chain release factor subunit 1
MSSAPPQQNEAEKNIEIWKVKKLIKRLEAARGNGTSMISLIIRKLCPSMLNNFTL